MKTKEAEILNNNDIAAYNKVQQKKREPRQQVKRIVDERPHNIILTRQRTKRIVEDTSIPLPRKRGRPRKVI